MKFHHASSFRRILLPLSGSRRLTWAGAGAGAGTTVGDFGDMAQTVDGPNLKNKAKQGQVGGYAPHLALAERPDRRESSLLISPIDNFVKEQLKLALTPGGASARLGLAGPKRWQQKALGGGEGSAARWRCSND